MQSLNDRKDRGHRASHSASKADHGAVESGFWSGDPDPGRSPRSPRPLAQLLRHHRAAEGPDSRRLRTVSRLPNEFTFIDPQTRTPAKLAKYATGDLTKPAAVYINPKSFDAVCPGETASQTLQLAGQIKHIIDDIRGETAGAAGGPEHRPRQQTWLARSRRQADRLTQQGQLGRSTPGTQGRPFDAYVALEWARARESGGGPTSFSRLGVSAGSPEGGNGADEADGGEPQTQSIPSMSSAPISP